MTKTFEKPIVQKQYGNTWEFVYPPSITDERVSDDFWEAAEFLDGSDLIAEELLKKLILEHPHYIDAYVHLSIAYRNQGKTFESLLTAEKAFNLGIECLPKAFNLKKDHLIWPLSRNRPFLRACQNWGLELQNHEKYSQAVEIYKLNLAFNPEDHQGIRYLLLEIFFAIKDYKKAEELLHQYPDDFTIEFKFGIVAVHILNNDLKLAEQHLAEAVQSNSFFIDEVIKTKHIKPLAYRIPGEPTFDAGIPAGSVQEAYSYWESNKNLYQNKKIISYFKTAVKLYCK
jgi:tetratricopeptide (TPR) repeat protein